jgi:hypothetical protein
MAGGGKHTSLGHQGAIENIESIKTKHDIIRDLADAVIPNTEQRSRLRQILHDMLKLSALRNRYIHARWFIWPEKYPRSFLCVPRFYRLWRQSVYVVQVRHLKSLSTKVGTYRARLDVLVDEISKMLAGTAG